MNYIEEKIERVYVSNSIKDSFIKTYLDPLIYHAILIAQLVVVKGDWNLLVLVKLD